MANEFKVRKGLLVSGSTELQGSFTQKIKYTNNTGATINSGDFCIASGSSVKLTDETSADTAIGKIVIATEAISNGSSGLFQVSGYYETASLTANALYYISSSGTITSESARFSNGDYLRIAGYSISETTLDFNPEPGYILIGTGSSVPTGTISGSSQVDYTQISNVPSGIVSSSTQLDNVFLEITGDNVISGSQQISDFTFISSSYTYTNNTGGTITEGTICIVTGSEIVVADQGSISTAVGTLVIAAESISDASSGTVHKFGYYSTASLTPQSLYYLSSSGTITTESSVFTNGDYLRVVGYSISETTLDFNPEPGYFLIGSSSAVPAGTISGSSQVDYTQISNVPSGILSSSQQVQDLNFISQSQNNVILSGSFTGSFVGDASGLEINTLTTNASLSAQNYDGVVIPSNTLAFSYGDSVYWGASGNLTGSNASISGSHVDGVVVLVGTGTDGAVLTHGTYNRSGTAGANLYMPTASAPNSALVEQTGSSGTLVDWVGKQIDSTTALIYGGSKAVIKQI